jgi:Protein of unknown function (DUF4239)
LISAQHTATLEGLQQRLRALSPQNDAQRSLQTRALDLTDALVQARWLGIAREENAIPTPLLIVLVFWLAAMFASFGLFAPRNAIAIAALFLGTLSVSAAIFVIEELNNPLEGFISIPRAPMERALDLLVSTVSGELMMNDPSRYHERTPKALAVDARLSSGF